MKRNKEDAYETIITLVAVARKHFTEHGYSESSMEEIAAEARLTRGALYHHFGSKKGLFQAVPESVQTEIGQRVETEAARSNDAWEQLMLGWEAWRRMDEENSMRHLREQLELMQRQGYLKPVPLDALTHFLSGALNESALWIAQSSDVDQSLEESMSVISLFLNGFNL